MFCEAINNFKKILNSLKYHVFATAKITTNLISQRVVNFIYTFDLTL